MSLQDPISDLLVQIKNGYLAKKEYVVVFSSKFKLSLLNVLKKECFIRDYVVVNDGSKVFKIKIFLKYYGNQISVMKKAIRISKPSLRFYIKKHNLPNVLNGFGIAIISTSIGLLTDKEARDLGYGGEVICTIE